MLFLFYSQIILSTDIRIRKNVYKSSGQFLFLYLQVLNMQYLAIFVPYRYFQNSAEVPAFFKKGFWERATGRFFGRQP